MWQLASIIGEMSGSLKRLTSLGLALLHNRLELFSLEVRREQLRFVSLLLWSGAAAMLAVVGLILAALALVYALPPEARLAALFGCAAFFVLAALFIFLAVSRRILRDGKPFEATLEALKKDRQCL